LHLNVGFNRNGAFERVHFFHQQCMSSLSIDFQ
jgi:hypothetical protein